MNNLVWVCMAVMSAMIIYMLVAMIYTFVITYNQTKEFINNLHVGDETDIGRISELDGDYVIIRREPLRIHRSDIRPVNFRANKLLFLTSKKK